MLNTKEFLILLLICQVSVISWGDKVPFYCSCHRKEIRCRGFHDQQILLTHFRNSSLGCKATQLRLFDCELPALPNKLLDGTGITEFRIKGSTLYFLSPPVQNENAFAGNQFITEFVVEEVVYPYNWNWIALNVCQNLTTLRIIESDMIYLSPNLQNLQLPSLRVLVIQNSNVKWIQDQVFSSLQGLAFFHLVDNKITTFRRNFLPNPANNLTLINLRNNDLFFIDDDLFSNMPELTYVNLQMNLLKTLSPDVITNKLSEQLFIDISDNPFICSCSLKWLQDRIHNFDLYRMRCYLDSGGKKGIWFRNIKWEKINCLIEFNMSMVYATVGYS